jgi:hypothetical protein
MPYHLRLYFDPDLDLQRLKPKETADGTVDHYDLGYVQNVIMTQVVAALREVSGDEAADLDPRFVLDEPRLPAGPGTRVNPDDPRQLLAEHNGYVLWQDGRILVKKVLTVPGDVDFHTGNILFVGDLVVQGSVRSGFEVQSRNLLVKGHIEGAQVSSEGSIVAESGVKGGKTGMLKAGKSMRMPFCENARLTAGENILVDGSSMHCELYAGKQLAVRGRLQGGCVYSNTLVFVGGRLGGGSTSTTRVVLGYDPFLLLKVEALEDTMREVQMRLDYYAAQCDKGPAHKEEFGPKKEAAQRKLEIFGGQREALWERIRAGASTERCVLAVPGTVHPGVEIAIGDTELKVSEPCEDVRFLLRDNQIVTRSPALKKE